MPALIVSEIQKMFRSADEREFEVLERSFADDPRKGVQEALAQAKARIEGAQAEKDRLTALYEYERAIAQKRGARLILGLDEAGRGPIAGPLAIGAVLLPPASMPNLENLNDSKQLSPEVRTGLSAKIKQVARAWTVEFIEPSVIDRYGMSYALRTGFSKAIAAIDAQGPRPDVILLDGNPLKLDKREVNVVKGDELCASIAAASILAKVARDELMIAADAEYPDYGFAENKGYATPRHIKALREKGISPIHRATFCEHILQPSLF